MVDGLLATKPDDRMLANSSSNLHGEFQDYGTGVPSVNSHRNAVR
jgi:hypothetical protein